jgi:hypothetical protein
MKEGNMTISRAVVGGSLILLAGVCGWSIAQSQDRPSAYVRVIPADIKWNPTPALPKGAQVSVLHGDPSKPGLFTVRVKLPAIYKLPVYSHPEERVRTIISGTLYSAVGEKWDATKLMAFPVGTFSHVPPRVWQFSETRDEEVVFQITGIGPARIDYLDPADDPRKK